MEKIYMENNNDDKERLNFKDFFRRNGIVITSVLIIIVAVAAFITGGFSQTSYAIPEVTSALPDTFKTAEPAMRIMAFNSAGAGTNATVSKYLTDGGVQVFCLERNVDFDADVAYSKGESIGDKDYGLLYLMANSYPNKNFQNDGQDLNEYLQTWITQIAIWDYLYQTSDKNNTKYAEIADEVKTVVKVRTDSGDYDVGGKNIYTTYIEPLVKKAIANRDGVNKDLRAKTENSEISLTEDEKYYQSSAVIVTGNPADNFNGYKVELAAAPKGTILVDSTGKEIEDLTNFTAGQKFWVRVPVDSVTEDNKIVKLSITGSFRIYDGNYYIAEGHQTISSVKTINTNVNTGLDIELNYTPDVPDTGMSTAQTIYFVGLVVLLSGLGIIYANIKPKESR